VGGEKDVLDSSHLLSSSPSNLQSGHAALKGSSNDTTVVTVSLALKVLGFPTIIFLSLAST